MINQELLLNELRQVPEPMAKEALDFIRFLKMQRESQKASFYTKSDLDSLATQQGVKPVTNFEDILGDFWPKDESIDEFVTTLRAWRENSN